MSHSYDLNENCSKHEAQPLRNDICLTLFYSEVQLTVVSEYVDIDNGSTDFCWLL